MSTTVDSRVVEMRFDNKQFESGVATTISSLEKLKQKLKLDGATKGMESIDAAAKKVNLSGIGSAVENVGLKFNAMYSIADQALRNITNSAVNAGKRIVSALTIEPVKAGLQEYETQINAVQTILANTESKGTTLKDVNSALDELNTYADKTIYNFTEMTRNIGTFTAAGVDLDTSVNAIQGIANLAAVSGSSSQQASTAMYQLSQAMASGTVKLMDWNSVVNAGMGGQVFQDALKETAKVHGVNVDAMIKKHGSFRETLQEGWITTDILTETLSHFTMAAEAGSDQWKEFKKSLMDQGYSEKQAEAILKMSNTATDAATKVKTASQLFDTLKETAQSGWTQTWELIFGDFEEAKNLFSMLYETLAPIIEASSKARNDILQGWAEAGGRNDVIESLKNIFEAIKSIVKPIKDAFNEIFPATLDDKVQGLVNFTKSLKEFTAKLKLSDTASENLKRTFKGLFAILDIVKQVFGAVVKAISPLFGTVDNLGGGILGVTAKIGDWLVSLNESIKVSNFFEKAVAKIHSVLEKVANFFKPAIEGIKSFANEVTKNLTAVSTNAQERLGPLAILGKAIMAVFGAIGAVIQKVFPYVTKAASAIGSVLSDLMGKISDSIQNADYDSFFDLVSGGIMSAIGIFIAKFIKSGGDLVDNASGFMENIKDILGGVGDALGAFTDSLKADTLKKIATAIAILAAALLVLSLIPSEKLANALVSITALFGELMGSMAIFGKMGDMKGIAKTATALIVLSSALLVLSVALKIMSTMSWSEMGVGLISLTVGLGALVGAVNLLPEKKVKGAAKAIKTMASALLILALGIKIMSTMSWEEMGIGLITMVTGLGAMVGAVNLLPKDAAVRAAGMIGLATAMVILGAALKIMATMSWEEIARGLTALGGSLGILAGAMALMKSAIPGAIAMMLVAPALVVLAGAMHIMSGLSWEGIARGLTALGGSLLIIAGAMALMKTAIFGAAALVVVAGALAILTPVLMVLGKMSLAEIGKSLLVLAGVFAVLGVSALVLQPLVPTIMALAISLTLLGVACVGIGAGVLLIAVGLGTLAAAVAASGGAITIFVSSLISLIPFLIEQIGVGIIRLCDYIAGSADAICKAVTVIVLAVVDAIVTSVPALVEGVLVLITTLLETLITYVPQIVPLLVTLFVTLLSAIADQLPTIVEAVFTFIGALIEAIAANIALLLEPLVTLFGLIFQGIADVIGPVVETVIAPILSILADLIVGFVEAIAPYTPVITAMVEKIVTVVADAIVRITEILAPFLPGLITLIQGIVAAVVSIIQQISPIIDSITSLVRTLGDIIKEVLYGIVDVLYACSTLISDTLSGIGDVFDTVFTGISDVITTFSDGISDTLGGIADVFDSAFGGIKDVLDSVGDSIKKVLDGIAGVIESVGNSALNSGKGFEKLANGIKIIVGLNLADMVASLGGVAKGVGDIAAHAGDLSKAGDGMQKLSSSVSSASGGFTSAANSISTLTVRISSIQSAMSPMIEAFSKASTTLKKIGGELIDNVVSAIDSQKQKLNTVGKTAIQKFIDGVEAKRTTAKNACTVLVKTCADAISSRSSLFKSAGKDLGAGLVKGINAKQTAVYNAGYALGQKAVQGEKDGQKSNSPSKLTILAGNWLGEGLIIGMRQMSTGVYNAGSTLGENAVRTMSDTISKISDIINSDVDTQPTIRPVLDLSGVQSGTRALNGMLGFDSTVGVQANISAISSMMRQRTNNISNADVVSAIDKLRKDITKIGGDTYQINGVTYDDGSNISDAIATIVRAARIERRV